MGIESYPQNTKQKDVVSAIKKKAEEHMASMSRDFNGVTPKNWELEEKEREQSLYFPTLDLKLKDVPQAKDWKVGEKYELTIKVNLKEREDSISREPNVCFEVIGVKKEKENE